MSEEEQEKKKGSGGISRRDFLKSAGLIAGGAIGGAAVGGGLTYLTVSGEEGVGTPLEGLAPGTAPTGGTVQPGEIKSVIKGIGFRGHGEACPAYVDVKNGKVVRIRTLRFDDQYPLESLRPWKIEARGKTFQPPPQAFSQWLSFCYKTRVYSPNRVPYPMKRVDWDPDGDRHPETRGISKYKRISWDEAATLVANELKRMKDKYGPYAVMHLGDGHGETKTIHNAHGCPMPLLDLMGGYTKAVRNPDSWEGYWWGSKHVWGEGWCGMMAPQTNVMKDVAEHTEMIIFQGSDPETTYPTFNDMLSSREMNWYKELGINLVFVCPDLNYSASVHANKWIPVLPNADPPLQLAIAYTWITEGTYDKEYVDTHAVGFDEFKNYVMGVEDGTPKTPEWASPLCGVPEWTIKALAREWAKKATSTHHGCGGSFIRGPYSHEPARLESLLLAMQGLGKPGVHQISQQKGWPPPERMPTAAAAVRNASPLPKQHVTKTLITKAITNPPISWYSTTANAQPVEDQFVQYHYPVEGCSEVRMIWSDAPCWTVNWNNGANQFVDMIRNPQIECYVVQHPWFENEMACADIILPTNTMFEEDDIGVGGIVFKSLFLADKAIEPVGESLSDYEAVIEVAKKLGLEDKYTGGKSVEEWRKFAWEKSGVADMVSWEDLQKKGYFVVPTAKNWEAASPGWRGFYEDPVKNPLTTPSGKIEFYSERLAEHFPDDKERPPSPQWVPEGITHQETLQTERGKEYPLLVISNHGRWREHAMHDDVPWFREIETCKVKGPDGYLYEPVWIHPETAKSRGIKSGDIVKLYNERAAALFGARVTERLIPGAVYADHGARLDLIHDKLDRGGNINMLVPTEIISKNCAGMATSGFLVEAEKAGLAQLEEWMEEYPEAFKRDYDPNFGLVYRSWIES